jgi:hypothetical protein
MIKKKGKKSSGKKTTKKRTNKKQVDTSKVRQEIAGIVKSGAKKITSAVMGHAMQGELAPAKYLFEVAGLYPASTDGSLPSSEEDCLAKTLLAGLNVPEHPVVADQVEGDIVVIPAKPAGTEAKGEDDSKAETAEEDEVKA